MDHTAEILLPEIWPEGSQGNAILGEGQDRQQETRHNADPANQANHQPPNIPATIGLKTQPTVQVRLGLDEPLQSDAFRFNR